MSLWTQRYNKYLTNLVFSARTVSISYGSSFFPLGFMAHALRAWGISPNGKNLVRNLQLGPRTRLVRGIYGPFFPFNSCINRGTYRSIRPAKLTNNCARGNLRKQMHFQPSVVFAEKYVIFRGRQATAGWSSKKNLTEVLAQNDKWLIQSHW